MKHEWQGRCDTPTIFSRRELLAVGAAVVPTLFGVPSRADTPGGTTSRLGVVAYSFSIRLAASRAAGKPGLADPLALVEHCHRLGVGGVQLPLGTREAAYTAELREKLQAYGMYLEGSARLPQDRADVGRFDAEVHTAAEAGARVIRTVSLGGRRYETFTTAAAFREWTDRAFRALTLAIPSVARHRVRLAVENHKDWRAGELADVLKRLGSEYVGVCVDTGNNLALLEDPLGVVEALAPWAFSVHLKDMAVAEYGDGFLLAEVPLGEGFLDLKKVVGALRKARPDVRFNLEMITRDPLKVPCLTPNYWATLEGVRGRELARALALVRKHAPARPLAQVSRLPREGQLAAEEDNVRRCLAYARKGLEL